MGIAYEIRPLIRGKHTQGSNHFAARPVAYHIHYVFQFLAESADDAGNQRIRFAQVDH